MIYLQLFLSFLQIGLFSFGGGYAAMPLIQDQVVTAHGWLSMPEFTDLITISQMTPGPIAINSATFVGYQVCGTFGAFCATLGVVLPSFLVIYAISFVLRQFSHLLVVQYAFNGIRLLITGEANAWIHCAAAITVLILGFALGLSRWEWVAVVFAIGAVLSAEAFNSAIEALADEVSEEYRERIKRTKDMAAGAVLLIALAAAVVGCIIFIPKLITLNS